MGSSYCGSCRCWPCSLSSPLWWGKGPWWFGSRVGHITSVSLSCCQVDKTSGWVVLCHQEGDFQVWAKVVPSLLFSLFFSPSFFLSCQPSWVWIGRPSTGKLGEMGRSNDTCLPPIFYPAVSLQGPHPFISSDVEGGERVDVPYQPSVRQSSRGYAD